MTDELIQVDDRDGVAVVRMTRGKVNALDLELLYALTATFTELDHNDATAAVLTGGGRAFSAGVDLWRVIEGGAAYVREFLPALEDAFHAVLSLGKPTVAAINGHAIAGGAILAFACDQRVMSGGTLGVTELLVGVPFPALALDILGGRAARQAVLTGATLTPEESLAAGHIDEIGPLDAAIARARTLAAIPADTFRLTKDQLHSGVRRESDPRVAELWIRAVEDGRIARYMNALHM
ncbi:enoyl-CoA hydratase/isomerase family protein [Paractinoplanes atraurantiacus]|uniref:Enoyl-CoA hydratase n=1 Tax=Paractinoplanes atraurantiacus TaxID=1036182 RepID=A0A285HNH3_9ACTN|nr:enoyl-CoA hydratase/isomerase family protein [Actinoplanes atraurantiacus]SNY37214.1 enoyl-CoA hydratase [Actinoplanes atraurantiacus]